MKTIYKVVYETDAEGQIEYGRYSSSAVANDAGDRIIVANRDRRNAGNPVYVTRVKVLTIQVTENLISEVVTNI